MEGLHNYQGQQPGPLSELSEAKPLGCMGNDHRVIHGVVVCRTVYLNTLQGLDISTQDNFSTRPGLQEFVKEKPGHISQAIRVPLLITNKQSRHVLKSKSFMLKQITQGNNIIYAILKLSFS